MRGFEMIDRVLRTTLAFAVAGMVMGIEAPGIADENESFSISDNPERLVMSVTFPHDCEYRIINRDQGCRIEMNGFGQLMAPGKPLLPTRNYLIALPPGAGVQSVEVKGTGGRQLPGTYRIEPAPPVFPLVDRDLYPEIMKRVQDEWRATNESIYASDLAYPNKRGDLKGTGTLRKYAYASISVYPFDYYPESGRLVYYDSAEIIIHYDLPLPGSTEARRIESLKQDTGADERAKRLFVNYEEVKEMYQPDISHSQTPMEIYDYVIITTDTLSSAITSSGFLSWKESLGYRVKTVLTTDPEITGQPGRDLAEQIRNFLSSHYGLWGIRYLLLVGSIESVPMRYCFPDPANHWNDPSHPSTDSGEVPTDYYYADLSYPDNISWDSDGDGFYGEYGQDSPDFLAEVFVGRIPTGDLGRTTYTLDKLVAFEQDTGSWKDQALQAGAILYFANEDRSGYGLMDGATCMNLIETDVMSGWTISHYSEQEGLVPSEYNWDALNHEAFIGDWRNGRYGVVNWAAHGAPNNVSRKVWYSDDGDGVPETTGFPSEMRYYSFINLGSVLDDDYPSILFAVSCKVGYPESSIFGNMGIDLLTEPGSGTSAGVLSSNRTAWIAIEWPSSLGGAESLCYEFNRFLIDGPNGPEKTGEALYDSKYYCHQNYGWDHFAEYLNLFNYNLYGEPSQVREGISTLIVDNSNADFVVLGGTWKSGTDPNAYNGDTRFIRPGPGTGRAAWRVDTAIDPGTYDVYAWKFEHEYMSSMATNAPHKVYHRSGSSDWIHVDQSIPGNSWVYLGTFEFDNSRVQGVMITNEADGDVIADAVKFVYTGPLR